eukprot:CAMPEP_0206170396 /NCGR_PEP_ID=MMETSP1474-20131121/38932_1 /ASSEMBLY_ACC=CAM_ASM_001110 /TAXON_ID=97495 /ORGANISM="Imantonia sp., Strain RCC918" /LENGTH=133 /DNA_ID=CAMNT_0053577081 /DNA_START=241 /DNA_END=640 /DNA_ORIENTATION=+
MIAATGPKQRRYPRPPPQSSPLIGRSKARVVSASTAIHKYDAPRGSHGVLSAASSRRAARTAGWDRAATRRRTAVPPQHVFLTAWPPGASARARASRLGGPCAWVAGGARARASPPSGSTPGTGSAWSALHAC